jgi:thioredoxin-related protein
LSSCLACNKFTPKLHFFNQLQSDDGKEDFEIVFCSMDRSEEEYSEYSEQMPWWCLPYAISTLPTLAALYHAQGLPHLVVIDNDGRLITKEGVASLTTDPLGKSFPWRPKRVVELFPAEYVSSDGVTRHAMSTLDEKYVMLYFAEKSCTLCEDFTPWLVKAYNILKKRRSNDFEVRSKFRF